MYSIDKLLDSALSLSICDRPEDVRIIFPYYLSLERSAKLEGGFVTVTDDEIFCAENGRVIKRYSLAEVSSFAVNRGIGCVSVEAELTAGDTVVIARGDNVSLDLFTSACGDLTRLKNGVLTGSPRKYQTGAVCPKCGRPYMHGSKMCMHCTGKSSYIKRLLKIASPWRLTIIASVILYFVAAAVNLIPPYLNKILVDKYINGVNPVLVGFVGVLASIFAVNVLGILLNSSRSLLMLKAGTGLVARLRQITFDKIQALSIAKINARTSGQLIHRVSHDTQVIKDFLVHQLGEIIQMLVTLVAVGAFLFFYSWKIALLVLCPLPLIVFLNRFVMSRLHKYFKLHWVTSSKASSVLHDTFSGIRVVKAFGKEQKEITRFGEASGKERDVSIRTSTFTGSIMPLLGFILGIGEFFILFYVGNEILGGRMTLGEMSQFSSYVAIVYGPLRWISRLPDIISRTSTSVVKIFEIIDEENEIPDAAEPVEIDIDGRIDFENVSFSYDEGTPVLKELSFSIEKGEMIGIVGRSGVGKSTLINLVMRLYDPQLGTIKVDGVNLKDISQASLRSQMGVVLQETYLFSGSIYNNIRYAKPTATRDEVIAAAKLSGAHKFIVKLPDGYNTNVGEKGYSLSGGERQRVSIARALLRDPKILILDEATSALDTETEKEVQDVLYKLTRGRTTLAIAHRLSTLRNADKILVLDRGRLAEFGPHEELMKERGIYYELVMAQRQMSKFSKK